MLHAWNNLPEESFGASSAAERSTPQAFAEYPIRR